jgi:hypothetical protein
MDTYMEKGWNRGPSVVRPAYSIQSSSVHKSSLAAHMLAVLLEPPCPEPCRSSTTRARMMPGMAMEGRQSTQKHGSCHRYSVVLVVRTQPGMFVIMMRTQFGCLVTRTQVCMLLAPPCIANRACSFVRMLSCSQRCMPYLVSPKWHQLCAAGCEQPCCAVLTLVVPAGACA